MKITLSFAQLLQRLSEGESVTFASFKGVSRKLQEEFVKDGILEVQHIGPQQKKVLCVDHRNLTDYLHHKFEIPELSKYIEFLLKDEGERSDAVKAASDSKRKRRKVFTGFLVNAYDEIQCTLNGEEFVIDPRFGIFQFIYDFKNFKIPKDITVVGVEGHENFREIERQRYLFKSIQPLFLWRYQNSSSIEEWLMQIPNQYLHFGDFDPAGLKIYISEFRNKIGQERCKFLIPENLEAMFLTNSSKKHFDGQEAFLEMIEKANCAEIAEVVRLLRKYERGLAQEVLIQKKY